MANKKKQPGMQALLVLLIAAAGGWYFFGGGGERYAPYDAVRIENQVVQDAIAHYRIVQANGSLVDACLHSGIVSVAFLQAKDEVQYKVWKGIQKVDCKTAGISNM